MRAPRPLPGGLARQLLVLALVLAVVGCGVLPRPFQPETKAPPDGITQSLGARAGIVVSPVSGLEPALSEMMVGAVVAALQARGMPASGRFSNRASLVLIGRIQDERGEPLTWTLEGPSGVLLELTERRPPAGWPGTTERDAAAIADRTAARVAAQLEPAPGGGGAGTLPPVVVHAVDGAPGDGQRSLADAMRAALAGAGVTLADTLADDAFLVLGSVYVEAAGETEETVEIAWTVLRPDGGRVGTVSQANTLPRGTLDGRWGPIARAIAQAGAPGVVETLRRGALDEAG